MPVERVKFYKLRSSLPYQSLSCYPVAATITVAGIFKGPAFLAFCFSTCLLLAAAESWVKKIGLEVFYLRFLIFTLSQQQFPYFVLISVRSMT
jgi:hypothetical protein